MSLTTLVAVAHGIVIAAVDPAPSPSTIEIPPEEQTSPGLLGFLVTFAVAAAVIALAFSLVRHLRVVDRNARLRDAEEAEAAERARADADRDHATGDRPDGPGVEGGAADPPSGDVDPADGPVDPAGPGSGSRPVDPEPQNHP